MTLKYYSMLNHKAVEDIYQYFHVPIDRFMLDALHYKFKCAWSRIEYYDDYLAFQDWFRRKYSEIPLDREFDMWLSVALDTNKSNRQFIDKKNNI